MKRACLAVLLLAMLVVLVACNPTAPDESEVPQYSMETKQSVVDEAMDRLEDNGFGLDRIAALGYSADYMDLGFYGKAEPEAVEIVRSVIDEFAPGLPLNIVENVTVETQVPASPSVGSTEWQTLASDNMVIDLLVDGHEVWAATSGGVVRWNTADGTSRTYTTADGLADNAVRKIIRDSNGNVWVSCYVKGVSRFDGTTWDSFTVQNGLCSNDIISLAADEKGGIWVSAYWGVSYFDGRQWESYSNVGPDAQVIGGENPMKDCTNLTHIDAELSAADVIFVDSRGDVWFSDRGQGVTRFDGQYWRMFTDDDGLARGGVNAIFEDENGVLWFGSSGGGMTSFDGTVFTAHVIGGFQSIIPRPVIMDIIQDNRGDIWVAAYGGGVARYDGNTWQVFRAADGLPSDEPETLFLTADGYPGVITDEGVSRFDGSAWQPMSGVNGFPDKEYRVAVTDDEGRLYFGSRDGVVYYVD